MGVCNCSNVLLYVTLCPFKFCNHLDGEERELVALLNLSSWYLVMFERLFLAVPWGCLRFVILVFPDYTHLLFWKIWPYSINCKSVFYVHTHLFARQSLTFLFRKMALYSVYMCHCEHSLLKLK